MNGLIKQLSKQFGTNIVIHSNIQSKDLFVWLSIGVNDFARRIVQANISSEIGNDYICPSKWINGELLPLDNNPFPKGNISFLETKDHYAILDDYDEIVYSTDSRIEDVIDWLFNAEQTERITLDEWILIKDIPNNCDYQQYIFEDPLIYIWTYNKEFVASIPPLPDYYRKLIPIIDRPDIDDIKYQIEGLLHYEDFYMESIDLKHGHFCILGIKDDKVLFSLKDKLIDLSLNELFSNLYVKDIKEYIKKFDSYPDVEGLYDQFIGIKHKFKDMNNLYKQVDTVEIDAQYSVSRIKLGYIHFLHNKNVDNRIKEILTEMQVEYTEKKHRVIIEWHGDPIFDMYYSEDIPQSILEKGKIIDTKEGGCCSQKECGGYTLEFDILVKGKCYLRTK